MAEPKGIAVPGFLPNLHALRGIAALLVVTYHALQPSGDLFSPFAWLDLGTVGVMVFFCLSGFVMVHAARDEAPGLFALRRIVGIAPLYWLMTLAFFAILVRHDIAAADMFRRVADLLAALFFIPDWHLSIPDRIWPVLVQGWTLNHEMLFYAAFAVGLALGRPVIVATGLLGALMLAGFAGQPQAAALILWTSPLALLFIAGMGLGLLFEQRRLGSAGLVLWPGIALALIGAGGGIAHPWSDVVVGLGAILILAGTLAIDQRGPRPVHPWLMALGASSYAPYLSHTIALGPMIDVLRLTGLTRWAQPAALLLVLVPICVLIGLAIHRWIELPMTRSLTKALGLSGASPSSSSRPPLATKS